jgi:hypothetical protein
MIRKKKGELAMNTKEKAEIWKEYSDKLLNTEELTTEDLKKAIRNLKNNKAAGTDGIHLELIQYGGNKLLNRMYEVVRQTWEENGKKQY